MGKDDLLTILIGAGMGAGGTKLFSTLKSLKAACKKKKKTEITV